MSDNWVVQNLQYALDKKKKIIKGTNLHFSSPINRDSQI